MRDKKQENEFHITVNDQKLEEIKAPDGHTYVAMPLLFPTLKELSNDSGRGLKRSRAMDIGTVKIVWQEGVKTHSEFKNSHRPHTAASFTQANKSDAKATGRGAAGDDGGGKAHASTTRAGKVIAKNERRACNVTHYKTIGEPTETRLLYRTHHVLEDMSVLAKPETDAESAERKAKRERRRKKAKLRQASPFSSSSSSSVPPPVPMEDAKVERPPPIPVDVDDDEVDSTKLEEVRHKDGSVYIAMPLFSKVSYGVEFVEEINGLGPSEWIVQKWPVCPYTVAVRNTSDKGHFATLYVDGQKVATKYVPARGMITFEGIPTEEGIQELLFSLPRYATIKEKDIGGRSLPAEKTSELGTIKVEWRDCVKTGKSFEDNYRTYGTTSYKQANKEDAKATKDGGGSGGIVKQHASTTRAGKVVGLNESRACTVTNYQYVGEPWEARLLYRTPEYLLETGVIAKKLSIEEERERKAKRARRRSKNKALAEAEQGGAFVPAAVNVDAQVPVDEEEEG
eukprot:g15574.t2